MAENSSQKVAENSGHVVEESTPKKKHRYARIPDEVLCDPNLRSSSVRVYGALSRSVWQGRTAKIGQRRIASLLGLNRDTVANALKELVKYKHLDVPERQAGGRQVYVLTSDLFGQKQGKVDDVHISADGRRKQRVSVRIRRTA